VITLIGNIFKLVLTLLDQWLKSQEEKKLQEYRDGREDIVEGDVTAVSDRIDRLLKQAADNRVERQSDDQTKQG